MDINKVMACKVLLHPWLMAPILLAIVIASCEAVYISTSASSESTRTCEAIDIEMCKNIGYNVTAMPNFFGHDSQADARQGYMTFKPLIQFGCSSQLTFFLCSVYVPMCTDKVPIPIGPCRPLCESVRSRCEPTLKNFGFGWPSQLNCSLFPEENGPDQMCMEGPSDLTPPSAPPTASTGASGSGFVYGGSGSAPTWGGRRVNGLNGSAKRQQTGAGGRNHHQTVVSSTTSGSGSLGTNQLTSGRSTTIGGQCSKYLYGDRDYVFMNSSQRCGQLCGKDVLFSAENKRFAEIWMAVWSVACFMTSAFTVLLHQMERSSSRSTLAGVNVGVNKHMTASAELEQGSDRAVVYLCLCYALQSIGYFIRLLAGRDAASCFSESVQAMTPSVLVHQGLQNYYCSTVFVFIYYFNNAASMWWLVVTVTWFMGRALRSCCICTASADRIRRKMAALHCAAWLLPACMTAVILVMGAVDADELSGVCLVGNQNRDTLLAFIILPQIACLSLGLAFLASGAIAIYRRRRSVVAAGGAGDVSCCSSSSPLSGAAHHNHTCPSALGAYASPAAITGCQQCAAGGSSMSGHRRMSRRSWIFAILYVIPAACVLGVQIYEYVNRDSWTLLNQHHPSSSTPSVIANSRPYVEYFSFKMFMSVVIGITGGLWTWCSKSESMMLLNHGAGAMDTLSHPVKAAGVLQGPPPLLVSTPFPHQPIMLPNQYFVPEHMLQQIQQQQQQRHTVL